VGLGRPPAVRTFRATVAYDGTDFHGWQVQGERRTVQGVLQEALGRVLGAPVALMAAGRTDAGVHAEGQVVSFRAATGIPPEGILGSVNAILPEDVALLAVARVPASFHATFSARGKVYRYGILCSRARNPLLRRTRWRVPFPLDAGRMRRAARLLAGRHDFRSFRTNPGPAAAGGDTVRHLRRIEVVRRGDAVDLVLEGDGFLYNMVRAIAGTLVQVGRGAWPPARAGEALAARDRAAAGPTAPAHGLVLVSVSYGGEPGAPPPRRRPGGGKNPPAPPRRT
jgi:tRNA pseudouridine38-40 synthase